MKQFTNSLLIGILCLFISSFSFAQNSDAFITIWRTTEVNESITIETNPDYTYDYTIDWGDGTQETNVTRDITHTYQAAGDYEVSITGTFPAFNRLLTDESDNYETRVINRSKLLEVKQWGTQEWKSMQFTFAYCSQLNKMDTSAPNLTNVLSTIGMFYKASSFNQTIENWNTANVVSMDYMFFNASSFNQQLDNWNISKVKYTEYMFYGASSFNQPLNNWNTSNIVYLNSMFEEASSFNQQLDNWDTSKVTDMDYMFYGASSFNQPLNNWNLSSVLYIEDMLSHSGISTENYDSTLVGWEKKVSENNGPKNINFGALNLEYCAEEARQSLIDNHGWTIDGDSKSTSCDTTTSTSKINNDNISIYPNPASDIININTNKPYVIYNSMGQKVLEGNEQTIDVSSLQSGLYIINIDGQIQKFNKL